MAPPWGVVGTEVVVFAVIIVAVVATTGAVGFATPSPSIPAVYEEVCTSTYGPPTTYLYLGGRCGTPDSPVSMPTAFSLIKVVHNETGDVTVVQEAYFGVFIRSGQAIEVSENSNVPGAFRVYFSNHTGFDTRDLANEAAHHARLALDTGGSPANSGCVLAPHDEWYIFVISVNQLRPAVNGTFDMRPIQASQVNIDNCGFSIVY
jgi:hypothetical protein